MAMHIYYVTSNGIFKISFEDEAFAVWTFDAMVQSAINAPADAPSELYSITLRKTICGEVIKSHVL